MRGIILLVLSFGLSAQAELIGADAKSPYARLQTASAEERKAFQAEFQKWISTSNHTELEKKALTALVSENPEISGDEVLEALDEKTIAWFYGFRKDQSLDDLRYNARKLSGSANVEQCKKFRLCVVVSKSEQRMYVYENGNAASGVHNQEVSTARAGKFTPTGTFSVEELAGKNRRSNLYKGAYLGYAMQIHGNIFLHATSTDNYGALGRPASAGCVRMRLEVAEQLNGMMRQIGRSNIRVVVMN